MVNTTNSRISTLISSQVPSFIRADHPTFVSFLEAYYRYLEQDTKLVERTKNLRTYRDVDLTESQFSLKLYSELLKYIPENVLVDKAMILKNIKDFYRAKGSEKSTRFLMRIMFNKEIDFYYPKKDILRASDGKWFIQKSLRVNDTKINGVANNSIGGLEKYVGRQVTGSTSNTTALVERVDRFFEQQTQIDEIVLSNLDGDFTSGETVTADFFDGPDLRDIQSNTYSGILTSIQVESGGLGYVVGDPVIILSSTGSGACAAVASVTTGNLAAIIVNNGGAGYIVPAQVSFSGGGGSGAFGYVNQVNTNESVHPNTYNIGSSTISLEANTQIGNTQYSNLNHSNANTTIANAISYWSYSNTGPIVTVFLTDGGSGYTSKPTIAVAANTIVYALGILGRLTISNGGQNYQIGDTITFTNPFGAYGTGASANVINVDSSKSNAISAVRFVPVSGHFTGGEGYDPLKLPTANVVTSTGNGASIVVSSVLSSGANLTSNTSTIGTIQRIIINNRGIGYTPNTSIDLTGSGDGTALANATVVQGTFAYPGRWLNDDGHISSFNFIQDRHYYQDFSYVIKSTESIENYRKAIKDLVHPAGMKLFGEYLYLNQSTGSISSNTNNVIKSTIKVKPYVKTGNTINVSYASHGLSVNSVVALEFVSGGSTNVKNGVFSVASVTANYFTAKQKSNLVSIVITNAGRSYNANSYLVFSGDGTGANATFRVNSNGSIISVNVHNYGINYTSPPYITANGSNSIMASFTSTIRYANNTSGNVEVRIT
jgi:hypothetical protein